MSGEEGGEAERALRATSLRRNDRDRKEHSSIGGEGRDAAKKGASGVVQVIDKKKRGHYRITRYEVLHGNHDGVGLGGEFVWD